MCCSRKTKSKFSFSFPARSEISFEGRPETSLWPPLTGGRSPSFAQWPQRCLAVVMGSSWGHREKESFSPSPQEGFRRENSLVGSTRFLSMATQRFFLIPGGPHPTDGLSTVPGPNAGSPPLRFFCFFCFSKLFKGVAAFFYLQEFVKS